MIGPLWCPRLAYFQLNHDDDLWLAGCADQEGAVGPSSLHDAKDFLNLYLSVIALT